MKLSSFEALAATLETAGVRYLIAGGLAVAAHGYVFVTEPFNFDAEYASALLSPLNDRITVRFVSLPTLIRMKEEADRPQDRADIEQLRGRSDNNANK